MARQETYAKAQARLTAGLVALGWTPSKPGLKEPHVTSPNGRVRLWWTPQSAYILWHGGFTGGLLSYPRGNARSMHRDYRNEALSDFMAAIVRWAGPYADLRTVEPAPFFHD